MYKIMLIDDEIGVRNSIKAKIDWEAIGYRIDLEASNGLEALQLLQEHSLPDVIISDVRMPQMDGISFIKACKEKYPNLRIIVLSGYSDFEYMKAAIQYGVKDYLLKPVVRSELTGLMSKLSIDLQEDLVRNQKEQQGKIERSEQLRMLQEQLIWQLVKDEWFNLSAVKERLRGLQLSSLAEDELWTHFVAMEMRIPQGRLDDWSERKDLMGLAYHMVCRETAEKWPRIYPVYDFHYPSMMYFLIIGTDKGSDQEITKELVRELKRNVKNYLRVDTVVGIGEPVNGLAKLKDAYASCMLSWSQGTIYENKGGYVSKSIGAEYSLTPELERKLTLSMENLDTPSVNKLLRDIFSAGTDTPMFAFTFLTFRMILLFSSIARKFELGDSSLQSYLWKCQMAIRDFNSREQVLQKLENMAHLVMDEVRKTRFTNGHQLIEVIRKYVDENYTYELSLSSLAEMFHMNETYLSGLFKQNAGVTFSDYVTRLRMAKAVELMEEHQLKLTDIATLVGYSSSSYFSTVFKKCYGSSPKDYRDALVQRK